MEMPKLTEQHRKLERLVGTWMGEETIHPMPWDKGGKATSRWSAHLDLDGFWLISDYQQTRNGQPSYRGHGVFGFDPDRKQYSMYWFDTMTTGTTEPMFGTWEGDVLTFQSKSPQGWNRQTFRFTAEGSYRFTIENSQDGKRWTPFIEATFRRV